MRENTVYEDQYFEIFSPGLPLNCRDDGGHLLLIKKEPVRDRSDLSWQEAIDFMRISMAVGKAMYEVLGIERMNDEDLGNWGLDDPGGPKMHLHFFGRARQQTHQIRGHHIFLYPKGHPIYQGHLRSFTAEDTEALRNKVAEILTEDKYRKMAALAGVE
jgi:diadenosine tetraphosphate (Ap4A) HIT family hydrolase